MASPNLQFTHSPHQLRRLKKIQFSVWSPEEIERGSVTRATRLQGNGEQVEDGIFKVNRMVGGTGDYGSLSDKRMGNLNMRDRCMTCNCTYEEGHNMDNCPGHFGHIRLKFRVFHCGYIKQVLKVLKCVCFHCSSLLADDEFKNKHADIFNIKDPVTRNRRLAEEIYKKNLKRKCHQITCGKKQPIIELKPGGRFEYTLEAENENEPLQSHVYLSADIAYEKLRAISDADCKTLGLDPKWARPEWFIVSVLPVPPPHVRPAVEMEGSTGAGQDDLTCQLSQILKYNNALKQMTNPLEIEKMVEGLQAQITAYFDNARADGLVAMSRSKRPLKTIAQRIKGKEGRIRGNLMGKRVDFSARTVITADPNLSIDQVGVPKSVALNLTVPITVTNFNKDELRALVNRGPNQWPGAKYVIRSDFSRYDLEYAPLKDIVLEPGWIVERHLQDDDIVLFNRQPSLHKMSLMGHRAKILDWSTFRLNLSVTTPYNADFDGDEMNLHVPQSVTARADAQELMMVTKNIVTHQSNRNVMGIVQDTLLGVYKMTKRDIFIDRTTFLTAMMWIPTWDGNIPKPAILKPKQLWTGKQLFSMVCPKLNYESVNTLNKLAVDAKYPSTGKMAGDAITDGFNFMDTEILILNGQLLKGYVDKTIVGVGGGSIIHVCWLQKGWEETRAFMNQLQTTVNYWLCSASHTVGVCDTVADLKTVENIQSQLDDARKVIEQIMKKAQTGRLELVPGKTLMQSLEQSINAVLNNVRQSVGASANETLKDRNGIKATVLCGSKGSNNNISQIIACVGQQNISNQRIQYGFKHRTLPHFVKYQLGMSSRGFIENSYLRGLTPQEFYFHAMCGREGCIDTAVKTSNTGYIQRRLVKAMESVTARYDGTCRNSKGCVMQFLYGEDGMDGAKIELQKMQHYKLDESAFKKIYHIDLDSDDFGKSDYYNKYGEQECYIDPDLLRSFKFNHPLQQAIDAEYQQLLKDKKDLKFIMSNRGARKASDDFGFDDDKIYLPVNLTRILKTAIREFCINNPSLPKLHPLDILNGVSQLINEDLPVVTGADNISKEAQKNATLLLSIYLRSQLSVKRIMCEHKLNEAAFKYVLGEIKQAFAKAIVAPGEMCGVLSAQSIGQPATQMTLNTFHSTGIGTKNVTSGVPRLEELLNVAKNLRTPSTTLRLKVDNDSSVASSLIFKLEYATLAHFVVKTEIFYDPDPSTSIIEADRQWVEEDFNWRQLDQDDAISPDKLSPWVLRLVLNRDKMDARYVSSKKEEFSMKYFKTKIEEEFENLVHVIHSADNGSDENDLEWYVLRVRLITNSVDGDGGGDDGDDGRRHWDIIRTINKKLLSDEFQLFGVNGIKKVYIDHDRKANVYALETDGSNLEELITVDDLVFQECMCNDVNEIFHVFGIEAARKAIYVEFRDVLCGGGEYMNARHLLLLSDCMCWGGYIMPISRHGVNRAENGPMLRATFEQSIEQFIEASAFSQFDWIDGVSENILLGQLARVGTGFVDLLVDHEKLESINAYDQSPQAIDSNWMAQPQSPSDMHGTPLLTPNEYGMNMSSPSPLGGFETPGAMYLPSPSPGYVPMTSKSPAYVPSTRPNTGSMSGIYNPTSPGVFYNSSVNSSYGLSSSGPGYSSPHYSPSSPHYSPSSPHYSPSSPHYSPSSPHYSPSSPHYSPSSPHYSPSSPHYSPSSPHYSPSSPHYSPSSPHFSPTSPGFSPTSNTRNSPSSPGFSPTEVASSPLNPAYSPEAAGYSPVSNNANDYY